VEWAGVEMFEQLFGSKTRVKLLSLFLNNPGRPFFVREITRKINSVRRELSNLLSIGIIKSESGNNKLYYEADTNYEHYKELRSIFTQIPVKSRVIAETKEEDQIAKKFRSAGQIELAILTGAFVRDEHASVDIAIVGDVNRTKIAKIIGELEKEMGRELNYSIMTSSDYNYRLNLNDRFLTSIMESKKIILIDGSDKPLGHTDISVEPEEKEVDPEEDRFDNAKIKQKLNAGDFAEAIQVRINKETE
jgi:predicted nucleotidyltransferase